MDYLSQQQVNIEAVSFSNVVILPNKVAGDAFFEIMYEMSIDVVVYTCDGHYPVVRKFKEKVNQALESRADLNIIVFGAKHILNKKFASKNIFIIDDLISEDYGEDRHYRLGRLDLNEFRIASIIRSFCTQSKKMLMGSNLDETFSHRGFSKITNKNYIMVLGKEL
jgi:adenosine deaminase